MGKKFLLNTGYVLVIIALFVGTSIAPCLQGNTRTLDQTAPRDTEEIFQSMNTDQPTQRGQEGQTRDIPPEQWNTTLGGANVENGYDGQQTADGGDIIVENNQSKESEYIADVLLNNKRPENNPPYEPNNPTPTHESIDVSINTDLSWTGGDPDENDTVTYDVYFGTVSPPPQVAGNQSGTTYDPGTLNYSMQYYWQIIAWDNHGAATPSQIWSFTTENQLISGSILAWGDNSTGQCDVPEPNTDFIAVDGGMWHSLGLKSNGSIVAWGHNNWGQCNVPEPNTDFIAIAAGDNHGLGLKRNGSIVAWGYNGDGQCNVPEPNTDFIAIDAGSGHSLGLKRNGSIVAWGWNIDGQCSVPTPNTDFIGIASGRRYSLGLKSNGSVVAWGGNWEGQCNVPEPNTDFIAISAGESNSLGLKRNGSIVAWGHNGYGECNVPEPNTDFIAIGSGIWFNLGLKSDGSIVAWGDNRYGQCDVPEPNIDFFVIAAGLRASFGMRLNQPPSIPSNLNPADESTDVSPTTDLSWTGGDPDPYDTVTYDVYFGTMSPPPKMMNNQSTTIYDPGTMAYNTTYYWQIIAWDNHGVTTPGPIWSFTTQTHSNNPPNVPSNPNPANETTGVSITINLSWTGGDPDPEDTVTYDVYFGMTTPPLQVAFNQSSTTYEPGILSYGTYYWRIISWDNHGATSPGPIWSFTTVELPNTVYIDDNYNENTPGWGEDHFNTIQNGINAVAKNGNVIVFNGTYHEHIIVNKTLNLIGENKNTTIIDGDGNGDVVSVLADWVHINRFTVIDSGSVGIKLDTVMNCSITQNILSNHSYSIHLFYSHNNTISNNIINSTLHFSINVEASDNNTISDNFINNNSWGIYLKDSSDNNIFDNKFFSNFYGIRFDSSTVYPTRNNMISNNTISTSWVGIFMRSFGDNTYNNIVTRNIISNSNYYGIYLQKAHDNIIYDNYFNNSNNAYDATNKNIWNITRTPGRNIVEGPYIGGNYWSDYLGIDIDEDGIGDTLLPYNSRGNIHNGGDWLPLMMIPNNAPNTPHDPDPVDNGANVSLDTILSWSGGDPDPDDTVTYDVYFGTMSPPPKMMNNQSTTIYDPGTMAYNTIYYWQIIAWDNHGASTPGPNWSFTTEPEPNQPPYEPCSPSPLDNSTNVPINTILSWTGGDPDANDTVTYDVYFGATNPPSQIVTHQMQTMYFPGFLNASTTYYWQIIAWDNHGASTSSPTWNFTTIQPGSIVAWQWNDYGQCNVPEPNTDFIGIAAGSLYSLGLKSNGSIVAWGGVGNAPEPNTNFIAIAAGYYHSLGLKRDGSIIAWGDNSWGQCNVPEPNTTFIAIAVGDWYSLGLKSDGSIRAWGYNYYGQCNVPEPNSDFIAIAAGYYHSLGLKSNGSIVTWGRNNYGQCNVPEPNSGFVAVAAGYYHSLGLKSNGSIVAWGWNDYGQCNVPEPNTGFSAIAGGYYHTLGLKQDGSIVPWGNNAYGQCNVPEPNTDFVVISTSFFHSLAIQKNNSPYVPHNPQPLDNATNVPITTTLNWIGGDPDPSDTMTYDVYFGTTTPPPKKTSKQSQTMYDPGILNYNTTYYWQIIAWDNHGAPTSGPIWQFTTEHLTIVYVDDDFNQSTPGWGKDHFNKIQDGINVVADHGDVNVYNGTYFEHVVVNKTIDLIGENNNTTIINGNNTGDVVRVEANFVNLSTFKITNGTRGIVITSNYNTITNLKIMSIKGVDGTGGMGAGIYLEASQNNTITNNAITMINGGTGTDGGFYESGGSGGLSAGIYLSNSSYNNLTLNTVSNLIGGTGGVGGHCGAGGIGGTAVGVYLSKSSKNSIILNTVINLIGGNGGSGGSSGSGGVGGSATGISFLCSTSNILTTNSISSLIGGLGGSAHSVSVGPEGICEGVRIDSNSYDNRITALINQNPWKVPDAPKLNTIEGKPILYFYNEHSLNISGFNISLSTAPILIKGSETISTGLALIHITNSRFEHNTISKFKGDSGWTGGYFAPGEIGGTSAGVYLLNSTNNSFNSNAISNILGGTGGTGGPFSQAGSGGISTGVYFSNSTANTLTLTSVTDLIGGKGGIGGDYGSAGSGGTSSGFYFADSTTNNLISNTVSRLTGGLGGVGGDFGSNGAGGISTGFYLLRSITNNLSSNILSNLSGEIPSGIVIDTNSYDNRITALINQNPWKVPDAPKLNTIEGKPILYFYNEHSLNISGFNISLSTAPILIKGSETISTGLALIHITNSRFEHNTISEFKGATGQTGGNVGGISAGVYLSNSTNNSLNSNVISNIKGGTGGIGGCGGVGGIGGLSIGIYPVVSTNNSFNTNIISNMLGGTGGQGGTQRPGGAGGISAGIYSVASTNNNFGTTTISNIVGGTGGQGRDGRPGGAGGNALGVYFLETTKNKLISNTIFNIKGGKGETGGVDGVGRSVSIVSSDENIIYNNYFNNTNNAYDDGNNIWNITKTPGTNIIGGPYLGGNYWSDYTGRDVDGDGLGNTNLPYTSNGQIQNGGDFLPLTSSNNAPNIPGSPQPPEGAVNILINTTLIWTGGDPDANDTVTYDVYFGTTNPPPKNSSNQTQTTYDPGTMDTYTTYYWKIVSWDNHGESTPGPIWRFTTERPIIVYVDDDFNQSTLGWDKNHFNNIQNGVNTVAENGEIYVYNGTYYEHVIVNRTVDLIGENKNTTLIDGGGAVNILQITTNHVNVSGFTILNAGGPNNAGICVYSSYNIIIGNRITQTWCGLYLTGPGSNNTVSNNIFTNNFVGIMIVSGNRNIILNNNVTSNNGLGVYLQSACNNTIQNNRVSFNPYFGVELCASSKNNIIINNLIRNQNIGVTVDDSSCRFNTFYHNNVVNNTNNGVDRGTNIWDQGYPNGGNYWSDYTGKDANHDGIGDTPYNISGGNNKDHYPFMRPNGWTNHPPAIPSNPYPSNGAINLSLEVIVNWTCSDPDNDPLTYDVYFGTTSPPPIQVHNQSATSYDPKNITYSTTYYWQIYAWDNSNVLTKSPIWIFTTHINNPPSPPANPQPANGATNVNITINLSWTGGDPDPGDTVTYDLYFGKTTPPPLILQNSTPTIYNPSTLTHSTTYYWQIISRDQHGAYTPGPIWNFTTKYPSVVYVDNDYNQSTPGWGIDHFNTIQAGVNGVINNGFVYVANGTYHERVTVNKRVDLRGADKWSTIVDGGGSGDVVNITANNVNISGFTIKNSSSGQAACVRIRAQYTLVSDIVATGAPWYGIWIDTYVSSSWNTVTKNIVTGNAGGILIYPNPNMGYYNTISSNTIFSNQYGIVVFNSVGNILFNNTVSSNSQYGIYLEGYYYNQNNRIFHNNFINNYRNARDNSNTPYLNIWDDGYPNGGNYWSDYIGIDANHDGIGDTGYGIPDGSNQDRYPLMTPWTQRTLPEIVYVDDDYTPQTPGWGIDHFNNLQLGVSWVRRNGVVSVGNGTYRGRVVVSKTMTLRGASNILTIIDGLKIADVVTITAEHVNISGFTIKNTSQGSYGAIRIRAPYTLVTNNIVTGTWWGIWIESSSYNTITKNTASGNGEGILIYPSNGHYNTVSNNTVFNNQYGIEVDNSLGNIIMNNTVSANSQYGFYFSGSSNNYIYHNNVIGNNKNAYDNRNTNYWDDGYPSGGNFWSDYGGVDADHDGIGDTPYIIGGGGNNRDRYPLMCPWSPGIRPPIVYVNKTYNQSTPGWGYDRFNTIQAGVYGVMADGVVYVANGTYKENPIISKSVNLFGASKTMTIIYGQNGKDVVTVTADHVTISDFTIKNTSIPAPYGAIKIRAPYTVVTNNIVSGTWYGIWVNASSYNTITKNTATGNGDGVLIYPSNGHYNTISSNNVFSNQYNGIVVYNSIGNLITNNTVSSNPYYGIYFTESSNNRIYHNNLISNNPNGWDNGNNQWDGGYHGGGNYWRDYTGVDANHDGIGDTQYNIQGGSNHDHSPLMDQVTTPPAFVWVDHTFNETTAGWNINHFVTIQEAINAVEPNGNVYVYAGTYTEHLSIGKRMYLRGENKDTTIIDGGGNGNVVNVTINGVTINGFTIRNSGDDGQNHYAGVKFWYIASSTILNSIIRDNGYGVYLNTSTSCTITNNLITGNTYSGIILTYSTSNIISWNTITGNGYGILLINSTGNLIINNQIYGNPPSGKDGGLRNNQENTTGIYLSASTGTQISGNTIANATYGLVLASASNQNNVTNNSFINDGIIIMNSSQNNVTNNTVNNKTLIYRENQADIMITQQNEAGQIILVNCTNVTIKNQTIFSTDIGIALHKVQYCHLTNTTINETTVHGILLSHSMQCWITGNTITRNYDTGITVTNRSTNISISGNNITDNKDGVHVDDATMHTIISQNILTGNTRTSILLTMISSARLLNNTIINNTNGIRLFNTTDCILTGNTICNNTAVGIGIYSSSTQNHIYYNNIITNTQNAYDEGMNTWNNTYPLGGNYWKVYTGNDTHSGPRQTYPGPDGMGDTPNTINGGENKDWYPFMAAYGWFIPRPPSPTQPLDITTWHNHPNDKNKAIKTSMLSYTYRTNSTQGNTLYYKFYWDDGQETDWLGPYPPGQAFSASHSWAQQGYYNITAAVKIDTNGYPSIPSSPQMIRVYKVGDTNGDNFVNFGDINPFVLMLSSGKNAYYNLYSSGYWFTGDINLDMLVNFGDINPFVTLLTR